MFVFAEIFFFWFYLSIRIKMFTWIILCVSIFLFLLMMTSFFFFVTSFPFCSFSSFPSCFQSMKIITIPTWTCLLWYIISLIPGIWNPTEIFLFVINKSMCVCVHKLSVQLLHLCIQYIQDQYTSLLVKEILLKF